MAITPALLTNGHFPITGSSSLASGSVTPLAGKTHIATFITGTTNNVNSTHTSVTGAGLTWTKILQQAVDFGGGTRVDMSFWRGVGTPSAGALTFNWSNTSQETSWWSVVDFSEGPTVRNSASHTGWAPGFSLPKITLPALLSSSSLCFGLGIAFSGGGMTNGATWSSLYDDDWSGNGQAIAEYKFNDTTVDFIANDAGFGIAIELAPAVATPSPVQLTFTRNTPTASGATSATATPPAKLLSFTRNQPTFATSGTASPLPVQPVFAFDEPVVTGSSDGTATPSPVQVTFTHNTSAASGGGVDGNATTRGATPIGLLLALTHLLDTPQPIPFSFPTPVAAGTIGGAPGDTTTFPNPAGATFNHLAPTVTGGSSGIPEPAAVQLSFTFDQPLVGGGQAVSVTPDPVALTFTHTAPTVVIPGDAVANPQPFRITFMHIRPDVEVRFIAPPTPANRVLRCCQRNAAPTRSAACCGTMGRARSPIPVFGL